MHAADYIADSVDALAMSVRVVPGGVGGLEVAEAGDAGDLGVYEVYDSAAYPKSAVGVMACASGVWSGEAMWTEPAAEGTSVGPPE